jgi:hypothetical protein
VVAMMKAIAHVINLVNDLANALMDRRVPADGDTDRVKPQLHLAILLVLALMAQNLMKAHDHHVAMIIDLHLPVRARVDIKVETPVNQANRLVIKDERQENQVNRLDTKGEIHVKADLHPTTKVKNQAIKAEIVPLRSVILNYFFE